MSMTNICCTIMCRCLVACISVASLLSNVGVGKQHSTQWIGKCTDAYLATQLPVFDHVLELGLDVSGGVWSRKMAGLQNGRASGEVVIEPVTSQTHQRL